VSAIAKHMHTFCREKGREGRNYFERTEHGSKRKKKKGKKTLSSQAQKRERIDTPGKRYARGAIQTGISFIF